MSTFEYIIVESKGAVGIITLNRPKMLNALSFGVFREIAAAVDDLEADDKIGCILLTGSEKAFAAGADIKEMQPKDFIEMFSADFAAVGGDRIARCRKPTIAAVSGYALGGGFEMALMTDISVIGRDTKIGMPATRFLGPALGSLHMFFHRLGPVLARRLLLTGDIIEAGTIEHLGIFTDTCDAASVQARAARSRSL